MKIVFAGTPEPAVVALKALIDSAHEVLAVITRPDAPHGRGRKLRPSPVRELADAHAIKVLTPRTLKPGTEDGDAARAELAQLRPDAIPVVAYGQLVPPDLLHYKWINLHFSLLPQWRGAAPVQAAIAHGQELTGASTFLIEEGLDTGPVFDSITEPIKASDTADDLLTRLAYAGADLLVSTLSAIEADGLQPQPQRGEPSYAAKILVEDARVDWTQPAEVVDQRIRAVTPGPGAWTLLGEDRLKLGPVSLLESAELTPGEVRITKKSVLIGTGTRDVVAGEVQAPGKRRMAAVDWARGLTETEGLVLQ